MSFVTNVLKITTSGLHLPSLDGIVSPVLNIIVAIKFGSLPPIQFALEKMSLSFPTCRYIWWDVRWGVMVFCRYLNRVWRWQAWGDSSGRCSWSRRYKWGRHFLWDIRWGGMILCSFINKVWRWKDWGVSTGICSWVMSYKLGRLLLLQCRWECWEPSWGLFGVN